MGRGPEQKQMDENKHTVSTISKLMSNNAGAKALHAPLIEDRSNIKATLAPKCHRCT